MPETILPEIITRAEAKARKLRHYFTGQPCKHGHIADRYVSTKWCVACSKPKHPPTGWALSQPIRQAARALELQRYFTGKPCKHGHIADRWVSTGGCIACWETRNAARPKSPPKGPTLNQRAREEARAAGLPYFTGSPCPQGHTQRYTSNSGCAGCGADYQKTHPPQRIGARERARAAGLEYYSTGLPCANGHKSKRLTSDGECLACAAAQINHWQAKPPKPPKPPGPRLMQNARLRVDAHAAGLKRFFTGEPCKYGHITERRVSDNACLGCVQLSKQNTRNNQSEEQIIKTNRQSKDWSTVHPVGRKLRNSIYRASYRAPPWVNLAALRRIFADCPAGKQVDHIVPLGGRKSHAITTEGYPISGLHVPWNLQYLPARDNSAKSNRMRPEDQTLCEALPFPIDMPLEGATP